ncbi:hypothetical protein, partial [Moorena bouillonii]|uniref:hypothetical protein n=1 Tax=Moorena bouillonii TaxID=207920 RepID=UPI001BE08795
PLATLGRRPRQRRTRTNHSRFAWLTGVDPCLGTQNPNHQQLHPEARTLRCDPRARGIARALEGAH